MLAVQALASRLVPLPVLGSGVLSLELLSLADAPAEWIDELADGRARYAILLSQDLSRLANLSDAGAVAWDSAGADYLLALDRAGGSARLARTAAGRRAQPARQHRPDSQDRPRELAGRR